MNGTESASREILWNVSALSNVVLLYSLLVLSLGICANGLYRRYLLWADGQPDISRFGAWGKRFLLLWQDAFRQRRVNRQREARRFHSLIFIGFLVLLFTTTMVFIDHDLGIRIYRGEFYLAVTVLSDLFGLGLLIGVLLAYRRRYLVQPDLLHRTRDDLLVLVFLALLVVQGFLLEALRIHATADPWAPYSPVGYGLALLFWGLSPEAAKALHFGIWWFHTLTVYAFIALIPYTKFFHIFSSSMTLFFRELERPKGAIRFPGDIEKVMESALTGDGDFRIGASTVEDLTWKERLDLDGCTSCGRCQNACPAYNSGKMLSPKWLILDARNHMLHLHARQNGSFLKAIDSFLLRSVLLRSTPAVELPPGFSSPPLAVRAENELVQQAGRSVGLAWEEKLGGGVIDEDVFWSCTTCRACVEACPVGIEHLDLIFDTRRALALMEGSIPAEAQSSLRAIEARGNPFGPAAERAKWSEGLDVPLLEPGASVDVLYWVGCLSAYDKRKQRIARSLVAIFNAAGIKWGMLGNRESCTGDPARRLGEENLFQAQAKKNIELLNSVSFDTLVANCPHCFNTIRNEYSQVDPNFLTAREVRVVHHSQYIRELLDSERIVLRTPLDLSMTYHDPCYLGRYNDIYEEPREILVQLGHLSEMRESRSNGLCCGAGGGHFWMDMKVGERINVQRVNQAAETSAQVIATSCPFCLHMLDDGVKLTDREGSVAVRDIAELVCEAMG